MRRTLVTLSVFADTRFAQSVSRDSRYSRVRAVVPLSLGQALAPKLGDVFGYQTRLNAFTYQNEVFSL